MLWIAAAMFALDRLTKWVVEGQLALGESVPVWPGVFHLTHIRNPGAAFGILPNQTVFFIVVTLVVIAVIIYLGPKAKNYPVLRLALGLQLGGALGNLVDRLRYGSVTDFLDFRVWPVFNIADSAIVVGGILLAYYLLRTENREEPRSQQKEHMGKEAVLEQGGGEPGGEEA